MHTLKRVDYLPYRLTNHGITILYHPPSEDLAQYEIFRAKVCNFWQGWYHKQSTLDIAK